MLNTIIHGDCLEVSEQIESGSVDLILTDPPYGTVEAIGDSDSINHGMKNKTAWDVSINPVTLHTIANRILRKNGKLILFAQEPYTNELRNNTIPNLPFCYRMTWEKDHYANSLIAKKAPVIFTEDILVFSKNHDHEALHPLRQYAMKIKMFTNYSRRGFYNTFGHGGAQHFLESNPESSQFGLCTEETYNELIKVFNIDRMRGFKTFAELREIDKKYDSTFNLWEGKKYKSNILKYKKDYNGYHPTQKPVLLLEDLIKTFSNEGDLVVDLTAGSGSTAIACINTGRDYICIEKDDKYYEVAQKRIAEHSQQLSLI